jgi:pyruvate dehydrogenase E1 component alpha subunit
VAARAAGYGMPGATLDGNDADAVHDATTVAVDRARAGEGPTLLELRVERITPHSSQDDENYRTESQRAAAAAADPLLRLRARLVRDGVLDEAAIEVEQKDIDARVREDLQRALAEPEPSPDRFRRWLFAEDGAP